jgi:6-pyruvoyltetrahydropterin/6-carboxytetrahydropterin synthase
MYRIGIRRRLTAYHQLIGGEFGPEGATHAHDYLVEVSLEGPTLDRHGFLFDIAALERSVDQLLKRYEGQSLNALPGFEGLNPTLERFARDVAQRLEPQLRGGGPMRLSVKIWEHESAWASHRVEIG